MSLEQLRTRIDDLDGQLLDLLNQRMEVVRQIGALKRAEGTAIYRPERELAILQRLAGRHRGLLHRSAIEAIFLEIFAVSRNFELPERIAYLGPEGSFTHQAAEGRFGATSDYLPLTSIRAVFEAVHTGRARFGVVPVENNQEGVVRETLEALSRSELNIAAEIATPIHFGFAALSDRLPDLRRIYSKDIAFGQCRRFLEATFGDQMPELIPVNSTSRAAQLAAQDPAAAAICAHIAARLSALPLLFDNIEDSADNFTRFFVLARNFVNAPSGRDKTSVLVRLRGEDRPGSLADFLQDFHRDGINLTKIESHPAKDGRSFHYVFFLDLEGHRDEPAVAGALQPHAEQVQWLGSYPRLC